MKFFFYLALFNIINSSYSNKGELQQQIFSDYLPIIPDNGVNLSLSLAIRAFNNIDQIDGSINMNIWLRYNWNSDISWNPSDYNNISSINLNTNPETDQFIWTPDIYLYNTAEKPMAELDYTKANVYSDGSIFWSRPGLIKSTCIFNLTYFPYDQQICKLKFGSWVYDETAIFLNNVGNNSIDLSNYQEHEEWTLIDYSTKKNSIKYSCCENYYHDIEFYYTIRRKPNYYVLNIILPTFATATLIILTLLVPWNSGERISFAVTVLLSIIVFLLIVSENLPKTDSKPLLSLMIIGLIYFSLVGVMFTVIISHVHYCIKNKTIQNDRILKYFFSRCQCVKCCINKPNKIHEDVISMKSIKSIKSIPPSPPSPYTSSSSDSDEDQIKPVREITQNYNENPNNNSNKTKLDLEKCKKLTIKIEKIFIILFLTSFIIYCLVIFFIIPKY
jgi:nicotinic acetylcholine receptor, invertebrate